VTGTEPDAAQNGSCGSNGADRKTVQAAGMACAPGVSHREPGGLTTRQVIGLIQGIDQPIVAADVVEYNASQDVSNLTALVAAKLVKEIAGMMLKTHDAA